MLIRSIVVGGEARIIMNAVAYMVSLLPSEAVRRLAAIRRAGPSAAAVADAAEGFRRVLDVEEASAAVNARWGGDLCGLLNALSRGELATLSNRLEAMPQRRSSDRGDSPAIEARGGRESSLRASDAGGPRSPALRAWLWQRGAALERGDAEASPALQPRPILLGGHLIVQASPRGAYPPSAQWPRTLPPPRPAARPLEEPETLDELLAAADRAIGVRLGPRGRDKGAWGLRAARLLGLVERNECEPDWRGDVEVKTVPVAREPSGAWRVVEDPAIAMAGEPALAKLQRTLWLARATLGAGPAADATIVSWYLLDWDRDIARLTRRDLHERPKGPAGTTARGLYLHKRFFAEAGLLATLNGPP